MTKNYFYSLLVLIVAGFSACVPARKLQETEDRLKKCNEEVEGAKTRADAAEKSLKDFEKEMSDLRQRNDALRKDTTILGSSLRIMTAQYDKINALNKDIQAQLEKLRSGAEDDSRKLSGQLEQTRKELLLKEESLNLTARELEIRKKELQDREARIKELEDLIAKKDAAVNDLKNKVSEALLGFKDKGLTVEERNGRVYVSMEAKLLFASGKYNVDQEGKSALVSLAKILETQTDLDVLVEGHTDTDALKSSNVPTDNWELSVLRATSVVKLMLKESKMDPKRVTAAGRSEFIPVSTTDKAKNRRIEIILIPDLNELYKLLDKK